MTTAVSATAISATTPGAGPRWTRHAPLLAAALVALLLYLPTLTGDWTMDDDAALRLHPVVRGDVPLWQAFTREFWGRTLDQGWSSSYRPLTTLAWALEARIGDGPFLHRLVGVLSYAGLCAAVAAVARVWMGIRAAWIAGLVFAVWPMHADNAASIVGRADVWAALAGIGSVCCARVAWGGPSRMGATPRADARHGAAGGARPLRYGFAAALLYVVALLCKETVALLPAIALWLAWLDLRGSTASLRRLLPALAPLVAAGALYLLARQLLLPVGLPPSFVTADNVLLTYPPFERFTLRLTLLGDATAQLASGVRLCSDHTYADLLAPQLPWGRGAATFGLGLVAAVAVAVDAWRALRGRSRGLLVAAALAYLLLGHWLVDLSVIAADRLLLWPSVWLALAVAAGACWLGDHQRRGVVRADIVRAGVATWIAIMAFLAWDHGQDWTDRVRLHQRSVDRCPAAVHNRLNLARELSRNGDAPAALWHFAVAAAGQSRFPAAWNPPAFAAETSGITPDMLRNLPLLVESSDPASWWRGLHGALLRSHMRAEAELAASLAPSRVVLPSGGSGAGQRR